MPNKNFNFSHILEYCDVINDAHESNNDYRHVIIKIKGKHLLKEHFVADLLFKQDEIDRFSNRVLRICTKMHTFKPFSMFLKEPTDYHVTEKSFCIDLI